MTDTTTQLSAIDILINRQNIALARSHKLLQSWLPPKSPDQPTSSDPTRDSDEDDFQDLGEAIGIGAKRKTTDDSDLGGILKRRRIDNDKLLENLIGKKAAQAKKKAQEAGKSRHAAPKSLEAQKPKIVRKDVESEDEEEGRASAFGSRKEKRLNPKRVEEAVDAVAVAGGVDGDALDEGAEPPDPREDAAVVKELAREAEGSEAEDARPKKRKAGSYLDELLAQKAKKKKNKKKKKSSSDA
ncbi:hypothetical protein DOTSEDRAFT_55618 [Dothistroma septosporum NZE10]|uniref:Uncharacterized protein n=1 Tax=Dothistroma septosporum (strain NZE10 / CBS 128990) TaxID=675120 RepID=N1PK42_DOTSN|nr:hypothetical protein DOTSEDRAFT_55618 [Dothistroma septosporum NZE10]